LDKPGTPICMWKNCIQRWSRGNDTVRIWFWSTDWLLTNVLTTVPARRSSRMSTADWRRLDLNFLVGWLVALASKSRWLRFYSMAEIARLLVVLASVQVRLKCSQVSDFSFASK
jgi:hypothetical protein